MAALFSVKDPRGDIIECSKKRWDEHICYRHPEVRGWRDLVVDAIREPHCIARDEIEPGVELYYVQGTLPNKYRYCWLRVVVRFVARGTERLGDVVTAFALTEIPTTGEKVVWLSKKRVWN